MVSHVERVADQLTVWRFAPSAQIAAYPESTGMSEEGKFYFLASQPTVQDASEFNTSCQKSEPTTAILGCYVGRKIFVYDVKNTQLDGIMDVTGAHEMLHAVRERMNQSEVEDIDRLIEAEYQKLKDNDDFSDRMAIYDRIEPGQRANELFSIIGTEVPNVGAELEAIYSKYFEDRSKVTELTKKYQTVFNELKLKSDTLVTELSSLNGKISADRANYKTLSQQLASDIQSFNARVANDGFTSQSAFNVNRSALIARSNNLEALRSQINADIELYNAKLAELKQLSVETQKLNESINSSLAPVPGVN